MTEDAKINRSWKSTARSDADVDLLRRSINHVEQLLDRLEYGAVQTPEDIPANGSGSPAGRLPAMAQGEALRITRDACEEANQLRAQAAAVHAKAITDSERLLVEARQRCAQLRADAFSEAAAAAAKLHAAAQEEADATRREADASIDMAAAEIAAEADAVRSLVHDTFSSLVEGLSAVLESIKPLASATGPHARLAAALAERQRVHDAAIDRVADAGTTLAAEGPSRIARR